MISTRTYFIVGLIVGVIVFLIGTFFGGSVASWIATVQTAGYSANLGGIADLIAEPLIWIMLNPLFGAIAVAFVWPALVIWLLLLFLMLVIGFGSDAANDVRREL